MQALVSPEALCFVRENDKSVLQKSEGKPWMDSWVLSFLQNVNSLLEVGVLARTRRAILLNWKVMKLCFLKCYLHYISV